MKRKSIPAGATSSDARREELAAAAEVALLSADREQEVFGRREAGREREFAGRLLFDLHVDDGAVRWSRPPRDLDVFSSKKPSARMRFLEPSSSTRL